MYLKALFTIITVKTVCVTYLTRAYPYCTALWSWIPLSGLLPSAISWFFYRDGLLTSKGMVMGRWGYRDGLVLTWLAAFAGAELVGVAVPFLVHTALIGVPDLLTVLFRFTVLTLIARTVSYPILNAEYRPLPKKGWSTTARSQ